MYLAQLSPSVRVPVMSELPNRREADRLVPYLIDRMDRADDATERWRIEVGRKLDTLPLMNSTVMSHEDWIKTRGEPTAKIVQDGLSELRGGSKVVKTLMPAAIGVGGVMTGAWGPKILAGFLAMFTHTP